MGTTRARDASASHRSGFFIDAEDLPGATSAPPKTVTYSLSLSDGEPLGRSDELPGVGDGVFLEVIAEGKIAQHLEKRVVALGEADVFQVVVLAAGANAFLRRGGAFVIALLEAEEDVLELVHSGVGEQQRGVIEGNERAAAHDAMTAFVKEFQECGADFVAAQ